MPEVEMNNMIYTVQSCYAVFCPNMIQLLKCYHNLFYDLLVLAYCKNN